ncbi:hypothetical protein CBOM_07597 [Ceraceosorus bombacis]|uniref:Uncharacterized protein n=1 Tax=Ceraceosorus bombacis TaxID=401625 RepID=A0A0P1BFK4_9BASI|nr:hypothetical protein CBOM_07597 [Ceraceosorus bombacis]
MHAAGDRSSGSRQRHRTAYTRAPVYNHRMPNRVRVPNPCSISSRYLPTRTEPSAYHLSAPHCSKAKARLFLQNQVSECVHDLTRAASQNGRETYRLIATFFGVDTKPWIDPGARLSEATYQPERVPHHPSVIAMRPARSTAKDHTTSSRSHCPFRSLSSRDE